MIDVDNMETQMQEQFDDSQLPYTPSPATSKQHTPSAQTEQDEPSDQDDENMSVVLHSVDDFSQRLEPCPAPEKPSPVPEQPVLSKLASPDTAAASTANGEKETRQSDSDDGHDPLSPEKNKDRGVFQDCG